MRTSDLLLAPVLFLLWLTKHTVDSVGRLPASSEVTGAYGGSVTVTCQYSLLYINHTKYWCKGKIYDLCRIVVKTPRNRLSDRSFIADDKTAGVFTVTMTSLRDEDEDMYWCVIAVKGRNIYTGVRLRITHTATTTSTSILTSSSPMARNETCWWDAFRWIFFILLLLCLVITHIFAWRIKTKRNVWPTPSIEYQNSNIYGCIWQKKVLQTVD